MELAKQELIQGIKDYDATHAEVYSNIDIVNISLHIFLKDI